MSRSSAEAAGPELAHALNSLEVELSTMGDRDIIVLSDFDKTLCDDYTFDAASNNHLAVIDPAVVNAAQSQNLVVATSRRVSNPTVPLLWSSRLVHPRTPVIVEDGGCILFQTPGGGVETIDLVEPRDVEMLGYMGHLISESVTAAAPDSRLTLKMGRTMLLARLQDRHGDTSPERNRELARTIQGILPESPLQVVDTRASVTVQHRDVNKGRAFRSLLDMMGVERDSVYVVGLGDGPNDREIFEEADLSLGFSPAVSELVDIDIPTGHRAAADVLDIIGSSALRARQDLLVGAQAAYADRTF